MKALSKKLLSWLCVMAMVLSLVPAVALPASASETEAPAIQYGAANLPDGVQEKIDAAKTIQDADLAAHIAAGSCPICGEGVTWLNYNTPGKVTSGSKHFVVTDETVPASDGQWCDITGGTGTTVCLALMNTQPKTIGGSIGFRDQSSTSNCTFNVLGSGTLIGDGTVGAASYGLIFVDGKNNTVNLYGGTFIYTGTGLTSANAVKGGAITFYDYANYSTVNIYDGVKIGPETQDISKQCYNVVVRGHSSDKRESTINMYGGTIRNGVSMAAGISGNVHLGLNAGGRPIFNMYGGTIENGAYHASVTSSRNGGNVYLYKNAKFNMYGGTVTGGQATNGGNFYLYDQYINTLTISGGKVENGTAAFGGNIYSNTTVIIKDKALIQNGISSENAANIYYRGNSADKYLQISGGKISGGTATYSGGSIFITGANGGFSKITGGVIEGASAGSHGGNIYLTDTKMTISNATISGGNASKSGGNIYVNSGELTLKDVTISDGAATGDGGNIYANAGTLTMTDAAVSGGSAGHGGSIYTVNTETSITGGTIADGVATGNGGNIYNKATTFTVSGATVSGGEAVYGGNLSHHAGAATISATLENGVAATAGGNINAQGGSMALNDTVLCGGKSGGQGANLRVYNMTINMAGGSISNVTSDENSTVNNVYLVRAGLNMSGNAIVTGSNAYGSAIRAIPHTYDGKTVKSKVILADNATVNGGVNALALESVVIETKTEEEETITETFNSTLYIKEGWAGDAYIYTVAPYTYGETIANDTVAVGNFAEDGKTFEMSGTFSGELYNESLRAFGVDGSAVMAAAAVVAEDGTKTSYQTNNDALAAYEHSENAYVILTGATAEIPETVAEVNMDIMGKEITISGNAKINATDSGNDGFKTYGKLIPAEGAEITVAPKTVRNGKSYIAVQEENGAWGFHRFSMWLDAVTLRTEGAGVYYKAVIYCDEVLRDLVDSYGVALSVKDLPGADFETADKYTAYTGEDFAAAYADNKVNTISGAVTGILKERNSQERNTANANIKIYANAYLKLNIGEEGMLLMGNVKDQGKTADAEGFSGTAYSMVDVLEGVNSNWESYSENDQATVLSFLEFWAEYITQEAAALLQSTLTNIFPVA